MTIGPEPIRRRRARSVLLGIEDVSQDIVEGAAGAPTRRRAQLRGITHQVRPRLAAYLAGIDFALWRDVQQLLQPRVNLVERDRTASSDVVQLCPRSAAPEPG